MTPRPVRIHYRRLPDRVDLFEQTLVAELDGIFVTLLESAGITPATIVGGRRVLEPGSPIVWFTYRDRWHDIGRFHLEDGTFTGLYANVLTPVSIEGDEWATTDLCLDVWAGTDGRVEILDEADLERALREGWIDADIARRARREASEIACAARESRWPPPEVSEWTLERARAATNRSNLPPG